MKAVLEHITVRESRFSEHPFFDDLRQDRPIGQALAFAPGLTFWVMTYQDVLRLNAGFIRDARLKALATRHHAESVGHERWFEQDLATLTGGSLSLGAMYGKAHASTRHAAYTIMGEVHRPMDDRVRIALLWVLESTSHVFFGRTAILTAAQGADERLRYFSEHHRKAEAQHARFEAELRAELERMELEPGVRDEALAMVDRVYAAFDAMFSGLRLHLDPAPAQAPAHRAGPRRVEVREVRKLEDLQELEATLALHRKGTTYPSA